MHVITGLGMGGAEGMLVRLVSNPGCFRHVVVSLTGPGYWGKTLRASGVELIDLGMRRGRPSLAAPWRLIRLIRRLRPALVQSWMYHADLLALLAGKLAGDVPVIWNLRCSDLELSQYPPLLGFVVNTLARLSSSPAAVIVNSDAGRAYHVKIGYRPRGWEVLPNGIDTDYFRPDPRARAAFRQRHGIAEDTLLIGMAARRDPMKDHEIFLQALAQVPGEFAVVLAGEGVSSSDPALAGLVAKTGKRVSMIGTCEDMRSFMAALDVAVHASRFGEGFPNVVAEAMACGAPVIASDSGDVRKIIDDAGIVVPCNDVNALSAAITRLTANREDRQRMGERGRQRVVELYSITSVRERYWAFWRKIATT